MKSEFRILSATAILGYGFPEESFKEGMKRNPHVIAVDAGSTDPGPYYLGAGVSFTDRDAVKRDLEIMLEAGVKNNIPVIIGTAGGSGGEVHLNWCKEIINEIAKEKELKFKLGLIHAEFSKDDVKKALKDGKISPLGPAPDLSEEIIEETTRIVGQMGIEPFIKALDNGANVILAGRTYDPSVFAAPAIRAGYDEGLALHLGKILECSSICATPGSGSDCMFGYIGEDYFRLEPLNPIRKCTTVSVAAHTLYEKTNPYILPGPGGHLDLTECKFVQEDENIVKVSGSKFVKSPNYTVKLEGAKCIGYRTVSIAGARDPIMIEKIDEIIGGVKERVSDNFRDKNWDYYLNINIYGRNGVMGNIEPTPSTKGAHEIGVVIDAVAETQHKADTICAFARSSMLHFGYEGRKATAGNLAFPYSPSDFHAGEVYNFSIYHLLEVEDGESVFEINYEEL
ncbi:MAG: acyclic terpene utilization AtuA family protein [Terrisporobacter sp.]